MYEELVKRLRECTAEQNDEKTLWHQSADAIEELQRDKDALAEAVNDAHNEGFDVGYWAGRRDYKPKWVHVMERLPEEHGRYIVLLKASEDETKRWIEWGLGDDADIVLEMFYDADQKIWKTEYGAYNAILSVVNREHDSYVTHWIPLPPPPKGGE